MRNLIVRFAVLVFAAVSTPLLSGGARAESTTYDRSALIAALERLMATGEPRHVDHDEGQSLQRAVDEAFQRNDAQIIQLAYRAAVPLVARITAPVSPVTEPPSIGFETVNVLRVPKQVRYTVRVAASLDGGDPVRFEGTGSRSVRAVFPDAGAAPGYHRVRLEARIAYEEIAGVVLPAETRPLPDLVYAIYDPAREQPDARSFVVSPAQVSAQYFDPTLPDVPFTTWLNGVLRPRGGSWNPNREWLSTYCDELGVESGARPRTSALCTVATFGTSGTTGQVWFRTGLVNVADGGVQWVVEAPVFEAVRLDHGHAAEDGRLSALGAMLARTPDTWPLGDVSVGPEDIIVTPQGAGLVRVEATVRNTGTGDLRGVFIDIGANTSGERGDHRAFVRDIPRGGETRIETVLALPGDYGVVVVHALQGGEHAPFGMWLPDTTPDDAVSFRIVNPRLAPKNYAQSIQEQCGFICRGY